MAQYTREEARIKAVQQKYFKAHNYRKPSNVLSFKEWLSAQFDHFDETGVSYEVVESCIFVKYPNGKMNVFTVSDFRNEYETSYLRVKPHTSFVQGCSA